MRLSSSRITALTHRPQQDFPLWDIAGTRPSLDLQFSDRKDLVDATTGSNLVDFTRASSGTYVGSDGLIKTATTNLLLQSEDFSTTWSTIDLTVSANTTIAPDGKLTADTLTIGSGVAAVMPAQSVTLINSTTYTISVYINSSQTCDIVRFRCTVGGSAYFTVSTKTWSDLGSGWTGGTYQEFSGGWIRASIQFVAGPTDGGSRSFSLGGVTTAGGTTPDTGNTLIYWGAQLEQSDTVGEYVKTTSTINSAPRFDHDPTTGESLGLLVEESRTNLLVSSEEFDDASWVKGNIAEFGSGSIVNATTAPDGTITADKITENTSSGVHQLTQGSVTSGATYTFSIYAKSAGRSRLRLTGLGLEANGFLTDFNLSTETVSGAPSGSSIVAVGNGWYRCTVVSVNSATAGPIVRLGDDLGNYSYTGDGTSGIYIWGAQLEAGSFPTSYIPTEGSTVTRAADVASISGSNFGAFRTNLLTYSEEFDQAGWTVSNSSVSANAGQSPDGLNAADLLVENSGTSSHYILTASNSSATGIMSFSVFAKTAGRRYLRLVLADTGVTGGNRCYTTFDLQDGVAATPLSIGGSSLSSAMIPAGMGWYRCVLTGNIGNTNSSYTTACVLSDTFAVSSSLPSYTGDGTSGIYLWGAQLEEGSTATNYIKSDVNFVSRASSATYYDANGVIQTAAVDEARTAAYLPDGNGNFVSAGPLLLEDAGTNLLLQSEEFDDAAWTNNTNVTPNTAVSPAGTTTADTLAISTAGVWLFQDATILSGATIAFSVFAKEATTSWVVIRISNPTQTSYRDIWFDLSSGSIGTESGTGSEAVTGIGSIKQFDNGFYRISGIFTTSGLTTARIRIATVDADASFTRAGSVYLWGAQLEESSYPTSYIPTSGSTATRAADVSTSAATTVFESDWYRQDEGTVFVNQTSLSTVPQDFATVFQFNDATVTNVLYLRKRPGFSQWVASGESSLFMTRTISQPSVLSVAYKTDDAAFAAEGTLTNDTSCTIDPNKVELVIGSSTGSAAYMNGTIRRLVYWDQRLPNDTLQTITQ